MKVFYLNLKILTVYFILSRFTADGFGLVTRFIAHFNTRQVTTLYNSLLHTN
jgi:hypothetical protein